MYHTHPCEILQAEKKRETVGCRQMHSRQRYQEIQQRFEVRRLGSGDTTDHWCLRTTVIAGGNDATGDSERAHVNTGGSTRVDGWQQGCRLKGTASLGTVCLLTLAVGRHVASVPGIHRRVRADLGRALESPRVTIRRLH